MAVAAVLIRQFQQKRRGRRGRRRVKNKLIFYLRMSQLCKSVQNAYRPKNLLRLNMHRQRSIPKEDTKNQQLRFAFSKMHRIQSFHVVVLQRTAEKCTKIQNARAQLLFWSSNLLFRDVPVLLLKLPNVHRQRIEIFILSGLSLSCPVDTKTDFNLNNIIATLSLISIPSVQKFAGKCPDTYSNLISTPLHGCQSW